MQERADLVSALEAVWSEIENTGAAGRSYVNLRRLPQEAIVQLLAQPRGRTACLALLETAFPNAAGEIQQRLAIMALWPSSAVPQLLSWLPHDPLSDVITQLEAQIQEYRAADSWFEPIVAPLSTGITEPFDRVAVSATGKGQNIPWHLIVQKAGWFDPEKTALPVIHVPGLAMLLFNDDAGLSNLPWQNVIDLAEHFKIKELDDIPQDSLQVLSRMPTRAGTEPLVVGDPSLDFPDAEDETAFLMTNFYTLLKTKFDASEALASAMHMVRRQPGWDDPYYWAGFVTFQRGMAD